jgi:hypothetical protein
MAESIRQRAVIAALLLAPGMAQAAPARFLPLERVRLYETGVGYFERRGALTGNGGLELRLPSGQIDDALKTLVMLNREGQATVSSVAFPSSVSPELGRALAGLPRDTSVPLGFLGILHAMRGAEVELGTKEGALRGRLLGVIGPTSDQSEKCVEAKTSDGKTECQPARSATVTILTVAGEVRRVSLLELKYARPLDQALLGRLKAAAQSSSRNARVERTLTVQSSGGSSVRLGYVAETPVWRSNYRLVFGDDERGRLQGWALVHNDSEEAWLKVRLELSSGRPDSFLVPLAAPRYARRELVAPTEELSTLPQLLEHSLDSVEGNLWGEEIGDSFGSGGLGLSGVSEGGGGRGEGIGLGSIGTAGHGAGGEGQSSSLTMGSLSSIGQVKGVEAGAMFNYSIGNPLDLAARSSALVPFVDQAVHARRIAWFASPDTPAKSALHLVNDTSQTLPAGSVALFADGGFAGEAQLARTKPAETRILRFGTDLDVELTEISRRTEERPAQFSYRHSNVVEHFVRKHIVTYRIVNRSQSARRVYLELEVVDNARVRGADEMAYDPERHHALAEFQVAARAQREPGIVAEEGLQRSHKASALDATKLREWADMSSLPRTQVGILRSAVAHRERSERAHARMLEIDNELSQADTDEERVRRDLTALGQDRGKAGDRLAARLIELEQHGRGLRGRRNALANEERREQRLGIESLARLGAGR